LPIPARSAIIPPVIGMDDIYGWRARLGLIYMASSWVMEPEFQAMAPRGVTVHTTRIAFTAATVEGVGQMAGSAEVERCTELLAAAPLHVICFGGTSASFVHGRGWDISIRQRMRQVARGIPVTTTSTASLAALRAVGARRVVFAGPYIPEVTERGRRFLEANGFAVAHAVGLGITEDHALGRVPLEDVYRLARDADRADADALFLSCTNFRTIGVLAALERDLGKPVVSAIQASFWYCLRLAGVGEAVDGYGRLLGLPAPAEDPEGG
jgi:maleate isomerase